MDRVEAVRRLAVAHHDVLRRINSNFPHGYPWGTAAGQLDPADGRLLSLHNRWLRDPTFRAAQRPTRLANSNAQGPPLAMMGYDNRVMDLDLARQHLPAALFTRWQKDTARRRFDSTELNFMDFVAQYARLQREGDGAFRGVSRAAGGWK